jgi:hypothetical protein
VVQLSVWGAFRQRRRQDVADAAYRDVLAAVPKGPSHASLYHLASKTLNARLHDCDAVRR